MASVCILKFRTKSECFKQFAKTYGNFPAREPIPDWYLLFEEWVCVDQKAKLLSSFSEIFEILAKQEQKGKWINRPKWMIDFDKWFDVIRSRASRLPSLSKENRKFLIDEVPNGIDESQFSVIMVRTEKATHQEFSLRERNSTHEFNEVDKDDALIE